MCTQDVHQNTLYYNFLAAAQFISPNRTNPAPQVKLRPAVQQRMAGMLRGAAGCVRAQHVFQGLVVRSLYAEINLET